MYLTLRAFVKLKQGDLVGAIGDCEAALKSGPQMWTEGSQFKIREIQSADADFLKCVAELKLGDAEAGERDIALALEQQPAISARYEKIGVTVRPN
jgi:hypothetical protein